MARVSSARRTPRNNSICASRNAIESFEKRVLRDFKRRLLADGIYGFGDEPLVYQRAIPLSPLYHSNFTPGRTYRSGARRTRSQTWNDLYNEPPISHSFTFGRAEKQPLAFLIQIRPVSPAIKIRADVDQLSRRHFGLCVCVSEKEINI